MPPTAYKKLATKLEWHNGATFAEVLGLERVGVEYGDRTVIDAADLATAVSSVRPKLFGLREPDKITGQIKFDKDDTVHAAMLADFEAGTSRQVRLTRTDATPSTRTYSAAVIVAFSEPEEGVDGKAMVSFTIQCNSAGTEA